MRFCICLFRNGGNKEISYQDLLIYDLYLRENVKSRPSFAPDPSEWKNETKQFFMREAKERRYLKGYEAYDSRQMAKMAHLERMEDGSFGCLITKTGMLCLAMRRHFPFPKMKYSEKWDFPEKDRKKKLRMAAV